MDLSLVPTNDLVDEIVRRHDAVILTGIKFTQANGEYMTFRRYTGNRFVCGGLLNVINHMLAMEEINQTIPLKNNEDR